MNDIKIKRDNNIICLNHENGFNLTVCFCKCNCDCHKNKSKANKHQFQKIINSIPPNLKLNSFKTNSFSKNFTNPILKDYSFDYYNNNTDNIIKSGSLSKQESNRRNNLRNSFDMGNEKAYDLISKGSSKLNQENKDRNKKELDNINFNYTNSEFIYYKNDNNSINNFINTLHEIKNREEMLPRCSSLNDFKYYNNKYLKNNKDNIFQDLNLYKNKNNNDECNVNIVYDSNNFIQNSKLIDKNFKNNKKSSNNYKNNNKIKKNNGNKTSKRQNGKNVLSQNNTGKNISKYSRIKKNDLFYNNYDPYTTSKDFFYRTNNEIKNKLNNYDKYDYKKNLNVNKDYYKKNNNFKYDEKYLENSKFNIIDNNLNPLGHIVDNFVNMLRNKNAYKNKIINKNQNYKTNNYLYNKYNNNIMNKKKNLDNMSLSNITQKSNNTYYNYNYSNKYYQDLKQNDNNEKKNNKKLKEKKEEYEQIYGNYNDYLYLNSNNTEKIIINNEENNNNNINNNIENKNNYYPIVFDNNKTYNFKKYNEDYISRTKKYLSNYITGEKEKEKEKENEKYNNLNPNDEQINKNSNNNYKINNIIDYSNIKLNDKNNDISDKYNSNYIPSSTYSKLGIETFDILINTNNTNSTNKDNINNINKSQISSSKSNKIEIQNSFNLSFYPTSKNSNIISNRNENEPTLISKISQQINNSEKIDNKEKEKENQTETVSEKVRKLINQKAKINYNSLSLSSKLNLDTNLSLSEENENENENDNFNANNDSNNNKIKIKRNIKISTKTFFTIYYNYDKPIILAFDVENKTFSFHDYSDFGNFEENYKLSVNDNDNNNKNNGNIFITIDTNLYIITGKNHDMLYMFDSIKKTMIKLCDLKNNHSNGNLLNYENNIICLSGDFNKKVEIYSINKNEWNDLPEMLIERSNSNSCILNIKENKYILNLFGYNLLSKEYLNTIEYLNINDKSSNWEYLQYNNPSLLSLNISKFFCINYNDKKIIIIGGYNGKDNKYNDKFIQIIFNSEEIYLENSDNIVEETNRKLKDIDINKKYNFYNGYKSYYNELSNELFYEVFDDEFNCHLFQSSNLAHDIYYFNC